MTIGGCWSHAMSHSKEHRGVLYQCQHCGEYYKKRSTFDTHVRTAHPDKNKSCDICGETFISALGLTFHMKKAHRQAVEAGSAACAACGVRFDSEYARARHRAKAPDGCENIKACAICGEVFMHEEALQSHAREIHQDRQTQCQEFASEASRSVHHERLHLKRRGQRGRRRHASTGRKDYMCEMCGRKCQNSLTLKYHIRTHTGEKPHACEHCTKRYPTPLSLKIHMMRTHDDVTSAARPHACADCHRRFATDKGLQKHLLKHARGCEPPFKCAICSKTFQVKIILQNHMNVHTGEKPFACDICGKTFTQSGSVHTHVKYVHKKLPAPLRNRGKHKIK